MAMSRYKNFSKVRSSQIDYFRLETFPPISASELRNIPHTTIWVALLIGGLFV